MSTKLPTRYPLGRLLLLGFILISATAYQVRVAENREPQWFGIDPPHRPFYISGPDHNISFLASATEKAGLKPGDQVLSINGRPLKGTAVFGEELIKSRPGDTMSVTVLRHEMGQPPAEKTFAVPLMHDRGFQWSDFVRADLLLIILPYLALLLGIWVAAARPRDPLAWLVLVLMMAYLCFGEPSAEQWGPYVRDLAVAFRAAALAPLPIWLFLFGMYFPEPLPANNRWSKWRRMKWFVIVPLGLFAVVQVVTSIGYVENYAPVAFLDHWPKPLVIADVVLTYMALGWAVGFVIMKYMSAISPDSKRRLRWLVVGSIIGLGPFFLLRALASMFDFNIEVRFPEWVWLSTYLLYFLFPLTLAYVIVVHRAMDVRVVLRQGLQYALAKNGVRVIQMFTIAAVFFAAVLLVASGGNRIEKIAVIVVGLAVVLGVQRGSEKLRIWLDRRFFREAWNAEQVLSELSDRVRTMVEPESLLQTVATRISETLHVARIAVLVESGSPYKPAYSIGCGAISDLAFDTASATVRNLQAGKEPVRVYLDDQDSWIYREAQQEEREKLSRLQPELLLPVTARDRLLGFVSLGPKKSEEPYTGNDLRLLTSVATQTGLALENAQLVAAITEEVAQRERPNREVEIAREVQERLFPQELPIVAGLDFTGACRPALGVGGDYYDFLALPGGQLGIAIGDVSGKGIAAALLMASLQASLRAEATRAPENLAGLIANVNRLVYQSSTSNRYATFFYAQYDPAKLTLAYVNAGHNPPMLFRKKGEIVRLTTGGTVVGLLESFPYQQETVTLHPGDVLVAFTDGISEAMNPAEEEWGEENLTRAVQAGAASSASELLFQILTAADAFASGARQHDDMTLIVLRVTDRAS